MYSLSYLYFCIGLLVLAPSLVQAATLGIPGNGAKLSGVSVISGWKCEAEGELTIVFNDDGKHIPLLYGTERPDVRANGRCLDNDHDNVGFVAIWNWGNLGDGEHTAIAYDDGAEFARSTFTVTTPGEEFLTGVHAQVIVEDFPSPGETTMLEWNESTQHFEMVDIAVHVRSMIDRPDDISGPQIHTMYVLPSDGVDKSLDTDGTIATSMKATQRWLSSQVSQHLRLDTFDGDLDITFFRLDLTDEEVAAMGPHVRDQIELELSQAGRLALDKIYAVYYGGKSTFACGGGAWPPDLPGVVAAQYLNGEPPGAPPCNTNPPGTSPTTMGYQEFAMLHEIFHTLGAVPRGAPNHVLDGHVGDDPTDLMYAGSLPWRPQDIDIGRDDYYGHNNPNLLDLEDSPYLSR